MTEMLPVSSSAHVIVVERLMHIDPSRPEMTFMLVMLHTGTMMAAIVYFWKRWKELVLSSGPTRRNFLGGICLATIVTGIVGLILKHLLEKWLLPSGGSIEDLFGNMYLIAASLAVVGLLIFIAGLLNLKPRTESIYPMSSFALIGAIQGICLPFRGFSRSGSTISFSLMTGMSRSYAEEFSFILAVVLTPPILIRETLRLLQSPIALGSSFSSLLLPGLSGLFFSFIAGLFAIRWLSKWLEKGKWHFFGIYCLAIAAIIFALKSANYL